MKKNARDARLDSAEGVRRPVLSRPRVRRARTVKAVDIPAAEVEERPAPAARPPRVLTLSSRRVERRNLPETAVPYLRMSGRWLAEHGFAIGAGVRVVVEQGRVTILTDTCDVANRH